MVARLITNCYATSPEHAYHWVGNLSSDSAADINQAPKNAESHDLSFGIETKAEH